MYRELSRNVSASISNFMDHPYFAQKNFILSILADIAVFASFLIVPRLIMLIDEDFDFAEFFVVTFPVSIITPFLVGYLIGYSSIKLFYIYRPFKNSMELKIDSGMMSGYSQFQEHSRNWHSWLFGSASGFLNLLGFTLLLESVKKII
jgi:hypothetical protein